MITASRWLWWWRCLILWSRFFWCWIIVLMIRSRCSLRVRLSLNCCSLVCRWIIIPTWYWVNRMCLLRTSQSIVFDTTLTFLSREFAALSWILRVAPIKTVWKTWLIAHNIPTFIIINTSILCLLPVLSIYRNDLGLLRFVCRWCIYWSIVIPMVGSIRTVFCCPKRISLDLAVVRIIWWELTAVTPIIRMTPTKAALDIARPHFCLISTASRISILILQTSSLCFKPDGSVVPSNEWSLCARTN